MIARRDGQKESDRLEMEDEAIEEPKLRCANVKTK